LPTAKAERGASASELGKPGAALTGMAGGKRGKAEKEKEGEEENAEMLKR
jgi:hypothetical protein